MSVAPPVLEAVGALTSFVGTMMMSAGYLGITRPGLLWWRSLVVLVEVWLPRRGRTSGAGASLNPPDQRRVLRGIGLVVAGFALQVAAALA